MFDMHPQYVTDKKGKKVSVILPIKEFKTMIDELEELEDIRMYDEAKKSKEKKIDNGLPGNFKKACSKGLTKDRRALLFKY